MPLDGLSVWVSGEQCAPLTGGNKNCSRRAIAAIVATVATSIEAIMRIKC